MVKECAKLTKKLEQTQKDAENTEKDLLNEIKQLDNLNEALQEKCSNLETESFTWDKKPGDFIKQYFASQCSEALSTFEEDEQKILIWSIQNGFDPIQDKNTFGKTFDESEQLRVHCLAKQQFEREASTFESLLENTKKEQFKDILTLHDKFAYELKSLQKELKTTFETHHSDFMKFKSLISNKLRGIEKQVQGMDFGKSKFFEKFLQINFCSCDTSQENILKRFRDHSKYTQEIRIPSIQSDVSLLFSQLKTFNIKPVGLQPVHKRFLKTFKTLKTSSAV